MSVWSELWSTRALSRGVSRVFGFGAALLSLALLPLASGCVPTEESGWEDDEAELTDDVSEALLEDELALEEGELEGDDDADSLELDSLIDVRRVAGTVAPGEDKAFGAPGGEGSDPSPQPWVPDEDDENETSSSSTPSQNNH